MRVVHIGFPKTATTFLQRSVFPRLSDSFIYFDKKASTPFFDELMNFDDTIYDASGVSRRFEHACEGRANALFSYEPLTGLHYRSAFANRTQIARRLRQAGFDRAIITLRNQFDALESAYKQYVKSGGILKCADYVTFDLDKPRYLYPEYFDYFSIYRLYADLFGAENVLVLQYENLRSSSFLEEICGFLHEASFEAVRTEAVNASLSCDKTRILRVLNHVAYSSFQPSHLISKRISTAFFYRQLCRLPLLNSRKSFLQPAARSAIAEFYRESNDKLRRSAGIALAPRYP
jgi:hypothetical protein